MGPDLAHLEKLRDGYVLSLFDLTALAILKVPDGERLEVVFEDRDQTRERAADVLYAMRIVGSIASSDPRLRNSDGSAKLVRWGFRSKADTVLFDQADYLCYALLQKHRDAESQKSRWCSPILEHGKTLGGMMGRRQVCNSWIGSQLTS